MVLQAQVVRGHRIHVVPRRRAVEHVGLEHGVVALAAQLDAVVGEHVHVEFQMLPELGVRRILQQRPQRLEHARALELRGRAGIVVRQRHIGRMARLDAEGDADDLRAHVVEAGGLGIEREQLGGARASRASATAPPSR